MDIRIAQGDLTQIACDLLVVNLFEGVTHPGGGTGAVDAALDGWITRLIEEEQFKGKANKTLEFPTFGKIPARRVLVVGLGKAEEFGLEGIRQAAATAMQRAKALNVRSVATLLHGAGIAGIEADLCAQALTEGSLLGAYAFKRYKSAPEEPETELAELIIVERELKKIEAIRMGVAKGKILADAENMARDLANEPPDVMTPKFFAFMALEVAKEYSLFCEVWDEQRITDERMNCLAMVGRASVNPPRFIRLDYVPDGAADKKICLIGKGLCYDSGGLSLKPAEHMHDMKSDMSGAAAVLGILRAVAQLKPNVAVTGLIPACENMIGGAAYKVDDILRARNGKTIEVDNTDAEGRLVLADALSYAAEQGFDEVIDMATLTGGCVIALARVWTGVMGNDAGLMNRLVDAGDATGERMWRLPFDKEIRAFLDSDIADIKNAGGREGSAMQGGIFLQEFAGTQPWAHLDIAGTSFLSKARRYEPKGATGVPVRALVRYITGE